jgi:hypothetical protein
MEQHEAPFYCAALRMKAGELAGVQALAGDVADYVLPRFIVPPQSERDETQPQLFIVDHVPDFSKTLARHWHGRNALVDLTYLIDECGRERMADWLPQLFARARRAGGIPIPAAMLTDLGPVEAPAFALAIDHSSLLRFAICVPFGDMVGPEFVAELCACMTRLKLAPENCAIIADFTDADFSDPRLVAPIVTGTLENLQSLGAWRHIIFQGTNFPDKNPAEPGGSDIWPRHEWNAWKEAVHFDPDTARYFMFGDFAAECSKIEFGGAGGRAIPHYRYATPDAWIVERGAKTGTHRDNMQKVCQRIVASGSFAGGGFSAADEFILRTAEGGSPGNSTNWRQVNTTHHITRVVADIAGVRGIAIREKAVEAVGVQFSLLP